MTPNYSPLDRFTIKPASDGLVAVTVHLPPDLVRDYCRFLESLADFFHTVDRKATIELACQRAAVQATFHTEAQHRLAEYRARLVTAFDAYTACGLDRKEAVKCVAADLRVESHPWCGIDLVRSQLVAAGRGGRSGRPRQVRP
jgi:hypothetical protein